MQYLQINQQLHKRDILQKREKIFMKTELVSLFIKKFI